MVLKICNYFWRWQLRTTTGQEHDQVVQAWLGRIIWLDPEATEPPLGVYPWFASDSEPYTPDAFLDIFMSNFRLKWHRCWDYYGWHWPAPRPASPYFSEPYTLDPEICSFSVPFPRRTKPTNSVSDSQLEKLEKKRRSQRDQPKYLRERCRIVLLPYLEAAVERYEKARTVAGKYELDCATTKVRDMYHPFAIKMRRLIANSANTITFTNAEGKRRDLLAVVVADEKGGDAYNPCLAYMGKLMPYSLFRERDSGGMPTMKTGIVHRNRKERGEKNCVVYGIATDGYYFQILKIDSKSNVRTCREIWDYKLIMCSAVKN